MSDEVSKKRERLEALLKAAPALPPPSKPAIHAAAPTEADSDDSPKGIGMRALAEVESSSGKNLNHPVITNPQSVHYGTRAGGQHAMMPLSFRDIVHGDKGLSAKYGKVADQEPDQITDYLNKQPKEAGEVAGHYYDTISRKFKGDPMKIAHAWNHGPGATEKISPKDLDADEYVGKYRKAYEKETTAAQGRKVQRLMSTMGNAPGPASDKPMVINPSGARTFSKAEEKVPAAACGRCGGWHSSGGMSQHHRAVTPVEGRIGCTCNGSASQLIAVHSLKPHEVDALVHAWPGEGIYRLQGKSKEHARRDVDRAVENFNKTENWDDDRLMKALDTGEFDDDF